MCGAGPQPQAGEESGAPLGHGERASSWDRAAGAPAGGRTGKAGGHHLCLREPFTAAVPLGGQGSGPDKDGLSPRALLLRSACLSPEEAMDLKVLLSFKLISVFHPHAMELLSCLS